MLNAGTVLTIDDEALLRRAFSNWLKSQGYTPIEAGDGKAGLAAVRESHPDLVLCDLRMPGMDGLEVLSRIREERPDLPVIVISGEGSMTDAIEALKRGAWDYMAKPIMDPMLFESAIERGMLQARLLRQEREHKEHLESLNQQLSGALGQLRTDQEAGRQIQTQLLPSESLTVGSYRFSRRLYPSLYLSGDFVDYFSIDQTHVAFYIADVSGHGAASAFVTVMLKTWMESYRTALAHDGDPTIIDAGATLRRIDQDLSRLRLEKHLTMFYGVLNLEDHTLEFCNGAHYPYPLLGFGDHIEIVKCPGPAIGLLPNAEFSACTIKMPKGARFFVASDGVLELMRASSLAKKLEALSSLLVDTKFNLGDIAARLGIAENQKLLDDVAMLLVERIDND